MPVRNADAVHVAMTLSHRMWAADQNQVCNYTYIFAVNPAVHLVVICSNFPYQSTMSSSNSNVLIFCHSHCYTTA